MDQQQFSKLKHDLRSDMISIIEAAGTLRNLPELPEIARQALELMYARRERVLGNLDQLSELAKSGVYKDQ